MLRRHTLTTAAARGGPAPGRGGSDTRPRLVTDVVERLKALKVALETEVVRWVEGQSGAAACGVARRSCVAIATAP